MRHFSFLIFLFITLSSCHEPKLHTFIGQAMTIPYRIQVAGSIDPHQKKAINQLIIETFNEVHAIFNKWNSDSEISHINQAEREGPIPLSPMLEVFLRKTAHFVSLSEGRFDPTIEPIQQIWKKHFAEGRIPSKELLLKTKLSVGWEENLSFGKGSIIKKHQATALDLCGIAKGHAIDLFVERLNQLGYQDVYVEWGGEIRTSGQHPERRPWRVAISKLGSQKIEDALAIVDISDRAVASSGDYLQNWHIENHTYTHIFDPIEGKPLEIRETSLCSATVITKTCMLADFLATTALLFPTVDAAEAWLEEMKRLLDPEMDYWVFSRENPILSYNSSSVNSKKLFRIYFHDICQNFPR